MLLVGIEISFFGIEILHSAVQHRDRLLPGITLCVLFWASTSCMFEVKEDLNTEKKIKNLHTPERHLDTKKESPLNQGLSRATCVKIFFRAPILLFKGGELAKAFACYRGHLGPLDPKWQESKTSSWASRPGAQKVQNGVEKEAT